MSKLITEYEVAEDIFDLGNDILVSEHIKVMKDSLQHGTTTVYEHVVSVAKVSCLWAHLLEQRFGITVDKKSLVRGALLHDYFMYDWHIYAKDHKWHGFSHANAAFVNAKRDFNINDIESDVIRKHMFPLNIRPPRHKESVLICLADKWCVLCETCHIDIASYIVFRINIRNAMESHDIRAYSLSVSSFATSVRASSESSESVESAS